MIEAAVQHLALRTEAMLGNVVAGPEWTYENIPRHLIEIGSACEQPMQNRADPTDFLNGLMRYVNHCLHSAILSKSAISAAKSLSARK
jgi:hypothetical protein